MTKVNNNSLDGVNLCRFVGSLSPEQLYWLITTPPLGDDILEHALACGDCARRVQQAGERGFTSLPTDEQAEHFEAANLILADIREHLERPSERRAGVPAAILNAAKLMGTSISEFLEDLIGFGTLEAPVPAAAGTVLLSASLDRFRGGRVVLELDPSGRGELRGHFDYPEEVSVSIYDPMGSALLQLMREDGRVETSAPIRSGVSRHPVRILLQSESIEKLILIVRHSAQGR